MAHNMTTHGTKGRYVWELIEDIYRQQLAGIEITQLQEAGIMSPTNYYQLRSSEVLPRYDIAGYLALCFFSIFVQKEARMDSGLQMKYRHWKSWDILLELTQAFALDFSKRCGNDSYPVSPNVKLSKKFKGNTSSQLEKALIQHDNAGQSRSGLIMQQAISRSIQFGSR